MKRIYTALLTLLFLNTITIYAMNDPLDDYNAFDLFFKSDESNDEANPVFNPFRTSSDDLAEKGETETKKSIASLRPPPFPVFHPKIHTNRDRARAIAKGILERKAQETLEQKQHEEPQKKKIKSIFALDTDDEIEPIPKLVTTEPASESTTLKDQCLKRIIDGVEKGTKLKFAIDLSNIKDLHQPSYAMIRAWLNLECSTGKFPREEFTQRGTKNEPTKPNTKTVHIATLMPRAITQEVINYTANIIAMIERDRRYRFPKNVLACLPYALCNDKKIHELTTTWYNNERHLFNLSDAQAMQVNQRLPTPKHFICTVIPKHLDELEEQETPKRTRDEKTFDDVTLE